MGPTTSHRLPQPGQPLNRTLARLEAWYRQRVERLLNLVLARDEHGPQFRSQAVMVFMGLLWLVAVLVERPAPSPAFMEGLLSGLPGFLALLVRPLVMVAYAVVHPNVLRHLVPPGLAIWWTLRSGARYLDDLLELNDLGAAERYLRSALFGSDYEWAEIKDGEVTPGTRGSTVFKVGGPGYLKIHMGNAALFERVGGVSTIAAATHRQFLHGFERLREVVDLRDQIRQPRDLQVYTRDGILVKATDIQVVFRLWSGRQSRNKNNPYPLDKKSVRQVVYGKAVGPGGQASAWTEAAAGMAAGAVARYIGSRLLKDLIAQKTRQNAALAVDDPVITSGQAAAVEPVARETANTRRGLSLSFYDEEAARRFEAAGVELIWIGVGTLDTPPDITAEWINAWQADIALRLRRSKTSEEEQKRNARARLIERLLTDISKWWNQNPAASSFSFGGRRPTYRSGAPAYLASDLEASAVDRNFSFSPSLEEQQPVLDVLRLYSLKLQEARNGLGAESLPPFTEEALEYIRQLSSPTPRIIGG